MSRAQPPADIASEPRPLATAMRETTRLRLSFLVPLVVATLVIVGAFVIGLYRYERRDAEQGVIRLRATAIELFENSLRQDIRTLRTVMDLLARDEPLRAALARRDRDALLKRAGPLFEDLTRNYQITHLYFTGTDRVNLVRAHAPARHGDVIERVTTRLAERTGMPAHGIELGPLGTFTLRLVAPWYDEQTRTLLGYVELGMETDRVLRDVRNLFSVEVFVLVRKTFLERTAWEEGIRTLGRTPDWERFPDAVLSAQSPQALSTRLSELSARGRGDGETTLFEMLLGRVADRVMSVPVVDAGGRPVARLVLLADVSREFDAARQTVYLGGLTAIAAGGTLLALFYWLVGRIGQRIERSDAELRRLASHDGLTGLYNRRAFDALLEEEITRAARFRRPVSLLMLDIDHFKRVNDTYGHRAGDAILRGLSELLSHHGRSVDRVCRYGGEEIALILPETDGTGAAIVAERLRTAAAERPFDVGRDQPIGITLSVGVASHPSNAASPQELVSTADAALYAAKQAGRNRVCRAESR